MTACSLGRILVRWRRGTVREAALVGGKEVPSGPSLDDEMPPCLRSSGEFRCMLPAVAVVRQPVQMAAELPRVLRAGAPAAGVWVAVNRSA